MISCSTKLIKGWLAFPDGPNKRLTPS
jgi:hypothetical protein